MKVLIFFLVLLVSLPLFPSSERSYQAGNYIESIEKKVLEINGVPSFSDLFFLGNAYFRAGEIKQSQLLYLNALSLDPRDPELIDNFKLTEEKLKNKQNIRFSKVSEGEILFIVISIFGLITFLIKTRTQFKLKMACYFLLFSLYFFLDANQIDLSHGKIGISLSKIDLMSGPDKNSISLYESKEGTIFQVIKKSGSKALVKDFDGNKGWISISEIFIKPNI